MSQIDAAALKMVLDAVGEPGAGAGRTAGGVSQELQPAANLARGVLDGGQAAAFHLGPVAGNVHEVLGVGRDLLEEAEGGLPGCQVLFALIFPPALFHQPVLTPDALEGHVGERQIPFALEPLGAEGGELTTQGDDLALQLADDLVGTGMRSAGEFFQSLQAPRFVAPHPLANGGDGGVEKSGRVLEAVLSGVGD